MVLPKLKVVILSNNLAFLGKKGRFGQLVVVVVGGGARDRLLPSFSYMFS